MIRVATRRVLMNHNDDGNDENYVLSISKLITLTTGVSLTSDLFCRTLITTSNSSDLDQARQNIGPDLDHNVDTLIVSISEIICLKI